MGSEGSVALFGVLAVVVDIGDSLKVNRVRPEEPVHVAHVKH